MHHRRRSWSVRLCITNCQFLLPSIPKLVSDLVDVPIIYLSVVEGWGRLVVSVYMGWDTVRFGSVSRRIAVLMFRPLPAVSCLLSCWCCRSRGFVAAVYDVYEINKSIVLIVQSILA